MSKIAQLTVKLGFLKKIVKSFKTQSNETDITFEYLVGSCFPTAWKRMQESLADEHTKGYIQAINEMKEGEKNVN